MPCSVPLVRRQQHTPLRRVFTRLCQDGCRRITFRKQSSSSNFTSITGRGLIGMNNYLGGAMVRSSVTFPLPAIACAIIATTSFS
jgi:hypothetical protein